MRAGFNMRTIIVACCLVLALPIVMLRYTLSGDDRSFAIDAASSDEALAKVDGQLNVAFEVLKKRGQHAGLTQKKSQVDTSVDGVAAIAATKKTDKVPLPRDLSRPEAEPQLAEWNKPYHGARRALREKQTAADSGPLHTHSFYTMDCTHHSLWQVMTLELTWERVKQGGFISRVISGCDKVPKKQESMTRFVLDAPESEGHYGSFFAPVYTHLPNGEYYPPINRPNGIWYWLNHTDLTEQVFVLLDPDMIYQHRLVVETVRPGRPQAQFYAYMDFPRLATYKCDLCPEPGSFNRKDYVVGPPWLLHVDDFRKIMPTWVPLVPMLKKIDNAWIIEMVAYAVACAYHKLPHKLLYDAMVDNPGQVSVWEGDKLSRVSGKSPALLHYCFTWEVGEAPPDANGAHPQLRRMIQRERESKSPVVDYFHWSKYRVPSDWPGGNGVYPRNVFDCGCPLLQEFHTPRRLPHLNAKYDAEWRKLSVFLERGLPAVNDALTAYKMKYCKPGTRNLQKIIRTSHPAFWESAYHITKHRNRDGTFAFVPYNSSLRV
jgi:hypothetical protein